VMMATTGSSRNIILPKLAMITDVKLAGLADSPADSLKMLVQEHPEVVIMDMDFGGDFVGLDTAKMMQKTRMRAAIIMMVTDLDPEELRRRARLFGTSWSYVRKITAARVDILEMVVKSAARGVQWVEPELSRPLAAIWKIAEEARDTEARRAETGPAVVSSPTKLKNARFERPQSTPGAPDAGATTVEGFDVNDPGEVEEVAPGIKTKSTSEAETDGLNITSVSVGHGGIGKNVGNVRKTG
jgi:DNA-binding NarL/FixJ family response regulator